MWGPPFTFSTPLLPFFGFLFSFFLSFLTPSFQGIFLVLLGVLSFLLVFSRCSVNCSICRCIFDALVRRDEFRILLFHHLDSSEVLFLPSLSLVHQLLDSPKYATKLNGHPGESLSVCESCDQVKITKQICLHTDTQAQSKKKYYLY